MTEITKACTVAIMKAKNYWVVRCGEKHVNWERKQKMVKIQFFMKLANVKKTPLEMVIGQETDERRGE